MCAISVLALSHFVLSFLVRRRRRFQPPFLVYSIARVCARVCACKSSSSLSSFFTWYQSLVQAREAKRQGTGVCGQLGLHGKTTPDEDGPFTAFVESVEILQPSGLPGLNFLGQRKFPGAFRPPFLSRRLFLQVFCRCK